MRITAFAFCIITAAMLIVSCMKLELTASDTEDATIETIKWCLVEVEGAPVSPLADEKQPDILLDPTENQARGFAGCNTFFSSYELDGASLTFSKVGASRMACPHLEMIMEKAFFESGNFVGLEQILEELYRKYPDQRTTQLLLGNIAIAMMLID